MSAADAREALEAVLWRINRIKVHQVDEILAAADAYATALAADLMSAALDSQVRIQRESDRRQRLVLGAAEAYGRTA